jgi:DNA repair protein RadC
MAAKKGIPKEPQTRTAQFVGHRDRLRKRFAESGENGLPDYELLELVLFNAIPRRDVKLIAKLLIAKFGDLSGVIGAADNQLLEQEHVTPRVIHEIRLIEKVALKLGQSKILHKGVLSSWPQLISYCRTKMAEKTIEEFHVLFLDKKNQIIADEIMSRGTVDHVPVYPRDIIKRALELDASGIILVHNHPSGDPSPSRADIDMTSKINKMAQSFSLKLHDHLIIGRQSEVSFKNLGLIV